MKIQDKRVLVTGGSSGIGLALAQAFAVKGAAVVITGRRQELVDAAVADFKKQGHTVDGVAADVTTQEGRKATLKAAKDAMGGIDILVNNAGGVRAGRLENTPEPDIQSMIDVNLTAPIMLTRLALPELRQSGDAVVVNIASGIALVGAPFYATYAAAKAGIARFGEALRRELKGEGVHVLTVYPGATETPMMQSNRAGPELGFSREPVQAVSDAIIDAVETDAFEVIRGGDVRAQMIAMNRENPGAVDERFLGLKSDLEAAVKDHSAL